MSDNAQKNFDTIVHLGAGRDTNGQQADYGARRIILVEANPDAADVLAARNAKRSHVTVLPKAVAGSVGTRVLNVLNLQSASSLNTPTGLKKLYPNIEIVKTIPVNTLAADNFIQELGLGETQRHLLVIDTPGVEYEILQSLIDSKLLTQFTRVHIHSTENQLYEGAKTTREIGPLLSKQGFSTSIDASTPDHPIIKAELSQFYAELVKTRAELAEAKAEIARLEKESGIEIARLERIVQEAHYRSELTNSELVKTDAQLELIKDFLSRNKAS
ncbi:FkbM family methyltransferase [Hyphococcus lacteus]|uniref:FkbM family methyltransferase n=1 Tax=Hyphococcus lacteus TaxID=3143536 RepID=A0ABV3Z581_9PROT